MASAAFQIFREWIAEADIPSDLALHAQFTEASPFPTFSLEGAYYGNDGIVGLNKTVQPLWDALVTLNDSVQTVMFLEDLNWIRACRYAGTLIPCPFLPMVFPLPRGCWNPSPIPFVISYPSSRLQLKADCDVCVT